MDIWVPIYRIDKPGLTVIQIGRESLDPYLVHLLYGEYLVPEKVGSVPVGSLDRAIRRWEAKADLIFFRSARLSPPAAVTRRMLMLPCYVQQTVDLPPSTSDLLAHFHHRMTKGDLDRLRKARFQYEITHDPETLRHYYHHLYVPYIQERHLESADIPPWPTFQTLYGDMELLLIRKDGRLVAGNVNQQIGSIYRSHVSATLSGERDLLKAGVMSALYWFSFVEAHRRGCLEVDMGAARPFLKDGVLMYKKKWSSRLAPSIYKRDLGLWLLPCGSRPSMRRALEDNPFFCEQDGRLTGLIFFGDHTVLNDEELAGYLRHIFVSGESLSIWIVLLTQDWAARAEAIRNIVDSYARAPRILDLSSGSLAELSGLLRDNSRDSMTIPVPSGSCRSCRAGVAGEGISARLA